VSRLRIGSFISAIGKISGIEKGIFIKTAPLTRTRSQQEWNVLYKNGLRMRSPFRMWSQYEQTARVCVTVNCSTLYRQTFGQIWPPNKFQFCTYFINKVYCIVTGPINTALMLCCFMCKGPVDNVDNASTNRRSARTGRSKARRHRNAQSFPVYLQLRGKTPSAGNYY